MFQISRGSGGMNYRITFTTTLKFPALAGELVFGDPPVVVSTCERFDARTDSTPWILDINYSRLKTSPLPAKKRVRKHAFATKNCIISCFFLFIGFENPTLLSTEFRQA